MSDPTGPPDREDEFRLLPLSRDAEVETPRAPAAPEPDPDASDPDVPDALDASDAAELPDDPGAVAAVESEPEAGRDPAPDDEPEPSPGTAAGTDLGASSDPEPVPVAEPALDVAVVEAAHDDAPVTTAGPPEHSSDDVAVIEVPVTGTRSSGLGAASDAPPPGQSAAEAPSEQEPGPEAPPTDASSRSPAEAAPVVTPASRAAAAARQASVRPSEPTAAGTGLAATRSAARSAGLGTRVRSAGASSILAVLAAVLVLGLLVDAVAAPAAAPAPAPVAQPPATSGAWYCPVEPDDGEAAVISVASAGDEPATVTTVRYADGAAVAEPPASVSPGAGIEIPVDGDGAGPVALRWSGAPVVATWRSLGDDGGAAPCAAEPSPAWYVAGLDTAGGSASRLHLFNPYPVDASASVSFATPDGELPLVRTDTIYVAAESSTVLELNDFVPEEPELGATVRVRTGRIVVQGDVRHEPAADAGGPVGRTLVPGAPAPEDVWGFAFARADAESASWLNVFNPSSRDAAVSVQVSTPRPDGVVLPEVTIPAGAVRRIDLADTSELPEFAVTVTGVNDVPVVVTRTTDLNAGGRRGVATSLGAAPAPTWELAGAGSDSRSARLGLSNPGPEPVTVDVTSGVAAVPAWLGVEIPPNGRIALDLGEAGPELASIPVRVNASGDVVPELRLLDAGEDLRFWTAVGVPAAQWTGPSLRPAVRRDPSLGTASIFSPAEEPGDGVPAPLDDETSGGATPSPDDEATGGEPSPDLPADEEPATEAPATEAPATEAPATEAPATEVPAADEPPPPDPAAADAPAPDAAPQDPPSEEPPPD